MGRVDCADRMTSTIAVRGVGARRAARLTVPDELRGAKPIRAPALLILQHDQIDYRAFGSRSNAAQSGSRDVVLSVLVRHR
jgi:hypothetical protein